MGKVLKAFFTVTVFLIIHGLTYPQGMTWQRLYNGPFNYDDVCRDLCYSDSSNFFAVGYSQQTGFAGLNIYILKLKSNGDTIWTRVLGERSNQYANTCVSSGDGGCVISGSSDSAFSVKIDKDGQIVWTKYYGNSSVQIFDITRTSDGGYIACGLISGSIRDGYVFKINSSGNLEWKKIFPANFNKIFNSVIQSGNHFIIAGKKNDTELSPTYGLIIKLDLSGEIVWEKEYLFNKFTSFNKILLNKGNYLVCGNTYDSIDFLSQIFFTKLDTSGVDYSTKVIEYSDNEYLFDALVSNNKFILTADTDTLTKRNARVYITDTSGNVQYQRIFHLSDYTLLRTILPTSGSDLIFGGTSQTYSKTDRDVYLVRADSTLFCKPLNINSNTSLLINNFKLYQNYPNPFNPNTIIKFELRKKSFVVIKVFNVSGREIKTLIQDNLNDGKYEILFEGKEHPSGIYFLKLLINNKQVDTKKMLLVK